LTATLTHVVRRATSCLSDNGGAEEDVMRSKGPN